MTCRATLAATTAAFNELATPLLASASSNPATPAHTLFPSLAQLQHLLDLFAHVERVEDKLIRSARTMCAREDLSREDEVLVGKYTRYLNSLLTSTIQHLSLNNQTSITTNQPPLLSLLQIPEFATLFPLFNDGDQGYRHAKHLFVRNAEDKEAGYTARTLDKYGQVVDAWNRGDGWQPSLLPKAKPLAEIIKGMQVFCHSVLRAQKDLQRVAASLGMDTHHARPGAEAVAVPIPTATMEKSSTQRQTPRETREETQAPTSSSPASIRQRQRERSFSVMTDAELQYARSRRQRSASLRPSMDTFLRMDERGWASRAASSVVPTRAESRAPSLDPARPTIADHPGNTDGKAKQRPRLSLPARLEPASAGTAANIGDGAGSSDSLRLPIPRREDGQDHREREMSVATRAVLKCFPLLEGGDLGRRVDAGVDGLEGLMFGQERQERASSAEVDPRTPPPPPFGAISQPRITTSATDQQKTANHVSQDTASPSRAAASAGPDGQAVRQGSVFVPSPGMKFEIDAQGRLVYVGGGCGAAPSVPAAATVPLATTLSATRAGTTSARNTFKTPESLAASREKVARAAEATRSPVPLAIIRSRASLGGAGGKRADGFTAPGAPPLDKGKRRHSEAVRAGQVEEEEVVEKRKRQRVSEGPVARSVVAPLSPTRPVIPGAQPQTDIATTATCTIATRTTERRFSRPVPFEDFEVERLPSRRRVRRSSGTAVAFSMAMRDAQGRASGEGSGRR
ncbi:hypothetical protein QFC21_006835 [Naganishia friedmannii]|uniref:Uncharacterized protein n=1 Tax=Naganishia friedmannii TaxID=89922 RepID=A0ACC2UZF4_9TREE|nr:hypothetical protein QFC21_006835 [Naganishia friedmannii]